MLSANELEAVSMALDKPMRDLEMRIMEDIIRRIKINGEITRAADWQINRLYELGVAKDDIAQIIAQSLDLDSDDLQKMYADVIEAGYARDNELYKALGIQRIAFEDNEELHQLLSAVSEQTLGELKNITQSLGFAVKQPDGKITFTEIGDFYQQTLDSAMLDIASGAFDYNTVLMRTVKQLTNSGLRSVDYATGWSNRVDVAARRAVMTGLSQLTAKVNDDNAKALSTNTFEVSWHSGARPSHQVWQGKWYTKEELISICGLGQVTGLCGANCYHDYYAVIPGISVPSYTQKELDELNAKENTPREYNGKQYTAYEATRRQRALERTMCAQRQDIKLLEAGGANEDDIINARARYRGTSAEYVRFSKAMDLPQQRERVTVDGLGNIGVGKYKTRVDKINGSDIIKAEIEKGNIKLKINHEKQARHIKGEPEYKEGKSYLTISEKEAQEIINAKSGTGTPVFDRNGKWKNKELVDCGIEIGIDVDNKTSKETPTDKATIHYSKTGTHLVPRKEEKT